MFKHIFHSLSAHKKSNFYIILGFLISIISLTIGITLYDRTQTTKTEASNFKYQNEATISVINTSNNPLLHSLKIIFWIQNMFKIGVSLFLSSFFYHSMLQGYSQSQKEYLITQDIFIHQDLRSLFLISFTILILISTIPIATLHRNTITDMIK